MRRIATLVLTALAVLATALPAQATSRHAPQVHPQTETLLVHVHWAAKPDAPGGGSWAWSSGGANPLIRAAMPAAAASDMLGLDTGDSVAFDGTVTDTWTVTSRTVWGKVPGMCGATVEVERMSGSPVVLCLVDQ